MIEKEIFGVLTKQQYEHYLKVFTQEFGKVEQKNRISFAFWNSKNKNVDTRIRITNGKAELMQKVGEWENLDQVEMEEIALKLEDDPEEVFLLLRILLNIYVQLAPMKIMEYKNSIFENSDFEIKLSIQGNAVSKYTFEVELKNPDKDLMKFAEDYGLKDLIIKSDMEFWKKWDAEVNLLTSNTTDLSSLKNLIYDAMKQNE